MEGKEKRREAPDETEWKNEVREVENARMAGRRGERSRRHAPSLTLRRRLQINHADRRL